MQRKVQTELAEHDLGQEVRAGATAADRVKGRRLLGDRRAGPAGEALAHVLNHAPARRHPFQSLGDILAELAEGGSAAARAGFRAGMHDSVARER